MKEKIIHMLALFVAALCNAFLVKPKTYWAKFAEWFNHVDGKLRTEATRMKFWFMTNYLPHVVRFVYDKRAMAKAPRERVDFVGLTVFIILFVVLVPIVNDQVINANQSAAAWNFTGGSGAKTLFLLLPFVFIIGGIIYFMGRLMGKI